MADVSARQVEAALDRSGRTLFQDLCQQLAQRQLFGEVLRAYGYAALPRTTPGERKPCDSSQKATAIHIRPEAA